VIEQFVRGFGPLVRRMWPSSFSGLERLPRHDRFLIVANHSGMGIAELWSLLLGWHERFGDGRPVAGMAHPGAFRVPPVRHFLRGLGAVEATRSGAAKARAAGVPLLLFPGGDHEATRPFWRADRVDFAGRRGWIRLARELGLDIVPLCITGSHRTLPILAGGKALAWISGARLLGIHRAPFTVLSGATLLASVGLVGAKVVPWWLGALGVWASVWATMALPWIPSRLGFHVLPPIAHSELEDPGLDGETYLRVVGALEARLRENAAPSSTGANIQEIPEWKILVPRVAQTREGTQV